MKSVQILFLVLFIGIIFWVLTSTPLLSKVSEGFQNVPTEPIIAKGIEPAKLPTEVQPNPSVPGSIPFGPYGQTASVGSFPYKDPSLLSGELNQIKKLNENLKTFLVFEGANISSSSDPSVQLPLTQLRADSQKLEQERSTLESNPGVESTMTQQDLADIEGALAFLQRKVRLFQTSGVVSRTEGFQDLAVVGTKNRATRADISDLQTKVYGAILTLSASATTDPVVQARITNLQNMYTALTDMLAKIDKGIMSELDIPVYKEDITAILPNLANPANQLSNIFSSGPGKNLSPVEKQLSQIVGEENAPKVFQNLLDKGSFNISMDLGYNVKSKKPRKTNKFSKSMSLQADGTMGVDDIPTQSGGTSTPPSDDPTDTMQTDSPFDSKSSGMDDRAPSSKNPSGLDWKNRAQSICEQVRLRGLDPLDFGCIPAGSLTSPAYSWRGHTKMVCGRLGTTMDPDLPTVCGCPPKAWKGWSLSY